MIYATEVKISMKENMKSRIDQLRLEREAERKRIEHN
jgi:hypothetical protein